MAEASYAEYEGSASGGGLRVVVRVELDPERRYHDDGEIGGFVGAKAAQIAAQVSEWCAAGRLRDEAGPWPTEAPF